MKIVTVIGARPQFIKAATVSRLIRHDYIGIIEEILVHTGQHFDENMSQVFFDELNIPIPKYHLGLCGGMHGAMTGRMIEAIELILLTEKPDIVLVYGDTNSTLAAALAAVKLHIPIAHIEAGLRSFNLKMPEEINRILTDRISKYLFCPTTTAANNLSMEGRAHGVYHVGDVMYDAALYYFDQAQTKTNILKLHGLLKNEFVLVTCHRAENTDSSDRLKNILYALADIANKMPVVFPIHPRTRQCIYKYELEHYLTPLKVINPLSFLEMIVLEQAAKVILTDSGGMQKEAFFYRVPCITMRNETEWVETVELGWNQLVGTDPTYIYSAVMHAKKGHSDNLPYGDGQASKYIVECLVQG